MGKNNSKIEHSQKCKSGPSRSTESLCTAVSLSSHADRCLLKSCSSLENLYHSDTLHCADHHDGKTYHLEESMSGQEENYDGVENQVNNELEIGEQLATQAVKSSSVMQSKAIIEEQLKESSDVVIPEDMLKRLTPEEWNQLFHYLFSSLEGSLQSSVLLKLQEFHGKGITCIHAATSDEKLTKSEEVTTGCQDKKNLKRPLSCSYMYTKKSHNQRKKHQSNRKSLVDTSLDDNCPSSHVKTAAVCFDESKQYKSKRKTTRSQSVLKPNNDNYLTLAELKDLGLALRQDSSNYSDGQSAFSMQCWIDINETGKKQQRLKRRRKHSKKASQCCPSQTPLITSTMEQLCYLGPNVDEGIHNVSAAEIFPLPSNDIKRTHQHHHFHHIIHHSISQPNMKECIPFVPPTKPASL